MKEIEVRLRYSIGFEHLDTQCTAPKSWKYLEHYGGFMFLLG